MKGKSFWEIGGFLAGGVLILFGIVAIFMGVNGYNTTRDAIKGEGITFGTADDPAVAKYADQWAGQQVTTGDQARAFAKIMRMHALEATGGPAYAQMGRFQSAAKPADHAGTNDEAAAAKDANGQPVANGARNIWVTETALTTALNMSYMAERLCRLRDRRRHRAPADRHRARDRRLRGVRQAQGGRQRGRPPARGTGHARHGLIRRVREASGSQRLRPPGEQEGGDSRPLRFPRSLRSFPRHDPASTLRPRRLPRADHADMAAQPKRIVVGFDGTEGSRKGARCRITADGIRLDDDRRACA